MADHNGVRYYLLGIVNKKAHRKAGLNINSSVIALAFDFPHYTEVIPLQVIIHLGVLAWGEVPPVLPELIDKDALITELDQCEIFHSCIVLILRL